MRADDTRRGLARTLSKNTVPPADADRKRETIADLRRAADETEMLPHTPFAERLLRQLPYITPAVWLVQAAAMLWFAAVLVLDQGAAQTLQLLSCMAPALGLVLAADAARSYGCNMWEMEAACRYGLRQIGVMRLCIVGGTDLLILGGCLCAFGVCGGSFWQFVLYVLFPFFLASNVYLWELIRFSHRCGTYLLLSTAVLLTALMGLLAPAAANWAQRGHLEGVRGWLGALTCAGAALLLWNIARLYGKKNRNREEGERQWNLE